MSDEFHGVKTVKQTGAILLAFLLLYFSCYFLSVRRSCVYCGSMPIDDPTWSTRADATARYRFFPASFWSPVHSLDRRIRPGYWTFVVTCPPHGSIVLTPAVIGQQIFDTRKQTLWERIWQPGD